MTEAEHIVYRLLESWPYNFPDYGEQEKPEHWGDDPTPSPYPPGIRMTAPDASRTMEWRFEVGKNGNASCYRHTVYWTDDYTQKPRTLSGMSTIISSAEQAQRFVAQETARFEAEGWRVEPLA